MSTLYRYTLPVEQTDWNFDEQTETCFTWEYDEPRQALLALYDKGKKQQWDAAERIDWSLDLDPENPMELVRDIGLWGPRVQKAFAEMGAMEFANVDAGVLLENDNNVADQFDADMRVKSAAD